MALIIEDGTIVANANSYNTDAEFVAYALARTITIPATEAARDSLQLLAVDYLQYQDYKGWFVEPDNQELKWPRSNAYANGRYIDSTEIPKELKKAQNEAAIAAYTQSLLVNAISGDVQEEGFGPMKVVYFKGGAFERVKLGRVNAALCELLLSSDDSLVRT